MFSASGEIHRKTYLHPFFRNRQQPFPCEFHLQEKDGYMLPDEFHLSPAAYIRLLNK